MVKRKIIALTILLLLFLSTFVGVLYAWFLLTEKTPPIIVYLGQIEAKAHLYKIEDEVETEIETLSLENLSPGATFDYKLVITNEGTITGDLDVIFEFDASKNSLLSFGLFKQDTDQNYQDFTEDYEILDIELDPFMLNESIVTIYFTVKISGDLELLDLDLNNNFLKITTITIKLIQQPPDLD